MTLSSEDLFGRQCQTWASCPDWVQTMILKNIRETIKAKMQQELEFVTGQTGSQKTRAPGSFPRLAPLNGLGRGFFFGIPCPGPGLGPRPTHTPDWSPLKMGGNKRGPVLGMSVGGPRAGAGRGLP